VGRNYEAHAREMGLHEREPPFFFAKPPDAVVPADARLSPPATVPYPPMTADLHHEIELVVAIGKAGHDLQVASALDHVWGYGVGLDLTRRDLQAEARKAGKPWDMAKGFDFSAPVSDIVAVEAIGHPTRGRIWLAVDGAVKQDADIADLIWNVAETLAQLSRYVALGVGDLVFTGTPAGVGPIARGQLLDGGVDGVRALRVRVV
jgi:fumarylpyruvate hydrolase